MGAGVPEVEALPHGLAKTGASSRARWTAWMVAALALTGLVIAAVEADHADTAWTRWLYLAAGAAYLGTCLLSPQGTSRWWLLALMLAPAAGMRAAAWRGRPIEDADYHRYLWDGAVTAAGHSPYRHAPADILRGRAAEPTLDDLARRGRGVLERINHPELRTIYPPAAQGLFAAAHVLRPFDVTGWRIVLLAFDVLAAWVVLSLLGSTGRRVTFWAVYLWNPLLIVETYCGGHLDLAAAALVALTVWCLARGRIVPAAVSLAAAIGVKLWPALLVIFLVRIGWRTPRRLVPAIAVLVLLCAAMALPFAAAAGDGSGLTRYAGSWTGGDWAYRPFALLGWEIADAIGAGTDGDRIGRGLMMVALAAAALVLGFRCRPGAPAVVAGASTVILLMLLLSPVLHPWYYVALLPLAAVRPTPEALIWTALLPLIYLAPATGWLAALVHVPVWLGLLWSWRPGSRPAKTPEPACSQTGPSRSSSRP